MLGNAPHTQPVKKQRKRRFFISHLRAFRQPILLATLAFLFSFSRLFQIPSPFPCVLVAVLGAVGESPLFALVGTAAALMTRVIWRIAPDPWQLAGCLLLAFARRFYYGRSERRVIVWTAIALAPRVLYSLLTQSPAHQLLALTSAAMGALCAPALHQATRLWREPKESWGWDDRLCCALVGCLILCALGYFHLFTVNLGLSAACLVTLLFAFCGMSAGAAAGMITGAMLALCGHGSSIILTLCACGMTSGLISRRENRWLTSLVFLLTAALISLISNVSALPGVCSAAVIAALSFPLIKTRRLEQFKHITARLTPRAGAQENTYASERLMAWESAIDEMARSLPALPDSINEMPWQTLRETLCLGCPQQENCQAAEGGQQMLLESFWTLGQEGEDALKDFIADNACGCVRVHLVLPAIQQTISHREAAQLHANRARLEQDMIRTHLTAMAQAVRRLSAAAQGESLGDLKDSMELERVLNETGFPAHLLYARRPGGHLQCVIESDTPAFTRWQPQRLISDLWSHGGISMEVTQLERSRIYLEETPLFRLETGSATLSMEEDNGDGLLSLRFPGGRHLLALSDGMGHGPAAHQESRETLNLLRLCLLAGYTRSQAITAVNGMMLSATGGDRFATVDLWTIDLWNGLAQVEKMGACQSCLWRGDKPRMIEGAALPLGILEKVTVQSSQIRLHDNDLILIFSDGVADAFETEDALKSAISRSVYQNPQRTADALLRQALIAAGGVPQDDMTVLAARLTQWSAPASPVSFTADR